MDIIFLTRLTGDYMTLTRFGTLLPSTVGFDRMFDVFENIITEKSTFPHHNIAKTEDNHYTVELAIAGFNQEEIDIEILKGTLHIRGSKEEKTEVNYLYRGIATRSFHKTIQLADTVEVKGAELENGILKIYLENTVPEEKKAKKITIGKVASKQQLLNE
jgi:molecular chaperone IbpA